MSEHLKQVAREPSVEATKHIPIIGLHIIGEHDPKEMSEQEFNQSPDLLFHGSSSSIDFNREYDYGSDDFAEKNGSLTLGLGFYTTADASKAYDYSIVRQPNTDTPQAFVTPIMPYQAKMLDLRSKEDPQSNGHIPTELLEQWRQYFKQYLDNKPETTDIVENILDKLDNQYYEHLQQLNEQNIDLRTMLGTRASPQTKFQKLSTPPWSQMFTEFMLQQGYDGIIQIEQSELDRSQSDTTYVFYNLNKIGDYGTWQNQTQPHDTTFQLTSTPSKPVESDATEEKWIFQQLD